MNNVTPNILLTTLENILEKIFIFQGLIFGVQHLKSGTLIVNFVMATLEDYRYGNKIIGGKIGRVINEIIELRGWGGGGGYLPFLFFIYQNIFPFPLYINNDRSLTCWLLILRKL